MDSAHIRNDHSGFSKCLMIPVNWYVDDVSVYNKNVQMLVNGGFETGSSSPGWAVTTPNGVCGTAGAVNSGIPRTGTYSFKDGSVGCADQLSQSFPVIAGQVYVVSFWIEMGGSGSGISISVILY